MSAERVICLGRVAKSWLFLNDYFRLLDFPPPKLPNAVFSTIYDQVKSENGNSDLDGLSAAATREFAKRVHDFVLTSRGLLGEMREQRAEQRRTQLSARGAPEATTLVSAESSRSVDPKPSAPAVVRRIRSGGSSDRYTRSSARGSALQEQPCVVVRSASLEQRPFFRSVSDMGLASSAGGRQWIQQESPALTKEVTRANSLGRRSHTELPMYRQGRTNELEHLSQPVHRTEWR